MASEPIQKTFISAQSLLQDSFTLGLQVLKSGFRPSFLVGVWRGGAPIGITVQEVLEYHGVNCDHIAIRTSSYTGIEQQSRTVRVHAIDYLVSMLNADDGLLLIDDVFDSGRRSKRLSRSSPSLPAESSRSDQDCDGVLQAFAEPELVAA